MSSHASEERAGFSDILAELTDSDLVVEMVANLGARRAPEMGQAEEIQNAVEA